MPKLAHISDIHFGPTFNVGLWKKVRALIEEFGPDVLVVSGDLVDDPFPFELLAVKCELEDLCERCPSQPQFFVVPGNHDVLEIGNIYNPLRAGWFNQIMFSNTRTVEEKINKALGIKLGLNEQTKDLSLMRKLRMFDPRASIWLNFSKYACDGRVQSCDYRKDNRRWPIESQYKQIALACFDSNPQSLRAFAFATGKIEASQVTRLGGPRSTGEVACRICQAERRQATKPPPLLTDAAPSHTEKHGLRAPLPKPVLLRVAVLHHHPLPIALPKDSLEGQEQEGKLEPFLVLRNSGDLLHKLQEQKFDLVLHGHKHRAQRARIELQGRDLEAYPFLVLAGGSTAKKDEASNNNTLRLIETESNGRLNIRTFENGRNKDSEFYREPLEWLKSRAYHRTLERVRRAAREVCYEVKLDGVGHVWSTDGTAGLSALSGGETIRWLPARIVVPPHGAWFDDLIQPEEFCRDRIRLRWQTSKGDPSKGGLCDLGAIPSDRSKGRWLIEINEPLEPGSGKCLDFAIRSPSTNSIAMTRWELQERKRKVPNIDSDYESIWRYVSYPVDRLVLRLIMPEELDGVRPEVRCRRHRNYPKFPLTFRVDEDVSYESDAFQTDEDVQREEASKLNYDAERRTWKLEVEHPIPGYIYELRWKVPSAVADATVTGRTQDYQTMLLRLRHPLTEAALSESALRCRELFAKLAEDLMKHFKGSDPHERQVAFLMVYDSTDLHLHTVLMHPPVTSDASLKLLLGEGVAGAAFLARRVLAWEDDPYSDTLIRPKPLPAWGLPARHVLALPSITKIPQLDNLTLNPARSSEW